MEQPQSDKDRAIALFEERGHAWVREQYETGRLAGFKERLATHWLAERDRSERAAMDRAAHDLASAANRKADTANMIATLALIAAVIAIALTVLAAFRG